MSEFNKYSTDGGATFIDVEDSNAVHWADNTILGAKNLLPQDIIQLGLTPGTLGTNTFLSVAQTAFVAKIEQNTEYIVSRKGGNRFRVALSTDKPAVNGTCNLIFDQGSNDIYSYRFNSGNYNYVYVYCQNSVGDASVIKPMLRLASDTDDTFSPYAMTNRQITERKEPIDITSELTQGEIFRYFNAILVDDFISISFEGEYKAHSAGANIFSVPNKYKPLQIYYIPFSPNETKGYLKFDGNNCIVQNIENSSNSSRISANITYPIKRT